MSTAKALMSTLKAFHLDQPDATWAELRDHLKDIAQDILQTSTEWERRDEQRLLYADWGSDLKGIEATQGLTSEQSKAISLAREIMQAAGDKLKGNSSGLREIIDRINQESGLDSQYPISPSLSVGAPQAHLQEAPEVSPTDEPLSYRTLAALHIKERKDSITKRSLTNYESADRLLSDALEALGVNDLRLHTRADLVALKGTLSPSRKATSLNVLLNRLSAVLQWAHNNGYIPHAYHKGLKVTGKATESTREAFSKDQQASIMAHCAKLPVDSWARWMLTLGVITGARIGEVRQLLKEDIYQIGNTWVIDINTKHGKALKNANSQRIVPLVDGALGFRLSDFLHYVEGLAEPTSGLCPYKETTAAQALNGELRAVLKLAAGGSLSFHSLRHSMAGRFKEQDVSKTIAEAVMGHSSQSITFDHYGRNQALAIGRLEEGIKRAFEIDTVQDTTNQGSETK